MATPDDGQRRRDPASRAFVQPLLVSIIGVVASGVFYVAAMWLSQGESVPCSTDSSSTCGYIAIGTIFTALSFLPVLFAGLLITGVVVGLSSRDSRLAFRAILVAAVILGITVSILVMVFDASHTHLDARQMVDDLLTVPIVAIALLLFIGLGLALGRSIKRRRSQAPPP
jgi:hypothetical protein